MKETIETREPIVLDGPETAIWGTYHKAYDGNFGSRSGRFGRDRVGVVFLNLMFPTRAGKGDSLVYWADSFAERGYPSFRLDLPGFGDSDGYLPSELLNTVDAGGYAGILSAKIRELTVRFDLSGVVLMGLCAGAVSALYTAAEAIECKGLVLMDPYFRLPEAPKSEVRVKFAARASQNGLGRLLRRIYHQVRAWTILLRDKLPSNSNFPLLRRWQKLVSDGLPILVLQSRTTGGKEFDYIRHNLEQADASCKVSVKLIEGAYHTFSDRLGRETVRQHTENWLKAFFPVIEQEQIAVDSVTYRPSINKSYGKHQESCLQR